MNRDTLPLRATANRPRCGPAGLALLLLATAVAGGAEEAARPAVQPPPDLSIEDRVEQLERAYSSVVEENRRLSTLLGDASTEDDRSAGDSQALSQRDAPDWSAGYDNGWFISPADPDEHPFELKLNLQNQFRYVGFARSVETWTDSAGTVRPLDNESHFELPRGRVIFSGFAFAPEFTYYLNIDYNTVSDRQINLQRYWMGYRWSEAFGLYVGQNKVPGSREWLISAVDTLGPDRSLATTFFRPSQSQGIWATGRARDDLHYHTMLSNGFNTQGTTPEFLDDKFAYSASAWWEPWGEFGALYSDLEWHDEAAVRLGASLTFSRDRGAQGDSNAPENAAIRLSDGTLLTATGAFAPGVTLETYDVALGGIDLGFKHCGWSLTGELYLRDLSNLRGNGPIPRSSVFDFGGFAQIGAFLLPQEFEVYGRTSQITGPFGSGSEYASGFNWFILPGKPNLRLTFDAAWLNRSPAEQNRTDYRAGDTGLLIRTQFQTVF